MPINPFNYNIDYFDSVPFGPITDSNFLNYLFTHNLQNLDPSISNVLGITTPIQGGRGQEYDVAQSTFTTVDVPDLLEVSNTSSEYNNFTNPLDDNLAKNPSFNELATWYPDYALIYLNETDTYKTLYGVPTTLQLGFVGNVETYIQNGVTTNVSTELIENSKKENKYGPNALVAYDTISDEILIRPDTGLIQYNTGIQGDFRDEIFNRTLGVGIIPFSTIGSGINYKPDGQNISELDRIARERRGFEARERVRINFIDDTVGTLNLDPLNLLAGGPLIQRDFTITRPANFIGRAAEFLAGLNGFSIPTSILQDFDFNLSIFNKDGSLSNQADPKNINEIDVKSSLLNRTGQATREILFDNIKNNKYGPNFEGDYETKNKDTYLNSSEEKILESKEQDIYGGFYGRFELYNAVGKTLTSDFNGNVPFYDDKDKNLTTYNGTSVEQDRDITISVTDERFDWRAREDKINTFNRGLLKYTQNLVNKSKLGDAAGFIGYFDSEGNNDTGPLALKNGTHQTGVSAPYSKPERPSKGNVTRNYDFTNNSGGDYYCRSWSSRRKYHTRDNLIRKSGNWWRGQEKNKNMTMNWGDNPIGSPKIAFEKEDKEDIISLDRNNKNLKGAAIPYMFSIENLAWKDAPQFYELPECEIGPNGGRIMWFPPYNINFSESNSVNWEGTSFIGRGENIYTYNNTERGGSLDFTIIVDHPTVLNQLRKSFSDRLSDESLHSFFAGCDLDTLRSLLNSNGSQQIRTEAQPGNESKTTPCDVTPPPYNEIKIYFENSRNASSDIGRVVDLTTYEVTSPNIAPEGINQSEWASNGSLYPCGPASANTYNYLNKGIENILTGLTEFLVTEDGKNYKIKIIGYTSPDNPTSTYNKDLAEARATNTKNYLLQKLVTKEKELGGPFPLYGNSNYPSYPSEESLVNSTDRWEVRGEPNPDSQNLTGNIIYGNPCDVLDPNDPNSKTSKEQRYVLITLEENKALQNNLLQVITKDNKKVAIDNVQNERGALINQFAQEYITECEYFEAIKRDAPFIYTSLQDKIKNFHPAFHSMTPEGLNSRLTFLNQCTRQGPQIINEKISQNMVFGRPPICVLRIGDFYNTKIVIDSININYEPLQWDLNPEGIGVQPMIAKVTMSFKFVGGSSLGGPIKQLQNAVSYNFYANTGVYQPWKYTEKLLDYKNKFIYGAFMTPKDAETAYGNINTNLGTTETKATEQNLQSVNTTANGTNAGASSDVTSATQAGMPTSTNNATPITTSDPSDDILAIIIDEENNFSANLTPDGDDNWSISKFTIETTLKNGPFIIDRTITELNSNITGYEISNIELNQIIVTEIINRKLTYVNNEKLSLTYNVVITNKTTTSANKSYIKNGEIILQPKTLNV
jgi:outer membrane protein OmpA-like peptidoglycan-associated protein